MGTKVGKFVTRPQILSLISGLILACVSQNPIFAVSSNPTKVCVSGTCTITFSYSGDYYSWTVPSGVTSLTFDVRGARGGNGTSPSCTNGSARGIGGLGGKVTGVLTVTSGSTLHLYVGGRGEDGITLRANGGFNGGGGAGYYNGNAVSGPCFPGTGGGASDIRTSVGVLSSRLIVAGGGGGAGGYTTGSGGAGGGLTAGNGTGTNWPAGNGRGGSSSAGGAAGAVCGMPSAGSLGVGGYGRGCSHGGGGGGGGYYGGGGGDIEPGGGGSSFANATYGASIVHTQGVQNSDGQIIISYQDAVDLIAPTFNSSTTFTASENLANTATAATIRISESATITISSGLDASLFNIYVSDTDTAIIKFKASPDFEAPADVGSNNVYEITLTAIDGSSNSGSQSITITITDVVDTSSFNSLTIASAPIYRTVVQVSANISVPAKVTFKVNNVRIPGCIGLRTTGTSPNIVATCNWKPSKRGTSVITAVATPTTAGIAPTTSTLLQMNVAGRTGTR